MMTNAILAAFAAIACTGSAIPACEDDSCAHDVTDETPLVQLQRKFGPWYPTPRPHPYHRPTPAPTPFVPLYAPAICRVFPEGNASNTGTTTGTLTFRKSGSKESFTLIDYKVCGLSPGLHGLHVHEKADFTNGCLSTLAHFNPDHNNHGAPMDLFKHLGDLGNILVADNGCAVGTNLQSDLPLFRLNPKTIIGLAIVVHALEDDLGQGGDDASRSPAGGNAGGRLACGEIEQMLEPPECPAECSSEKCEDGTIYGGAPLNDDGVCTYYCGSAHGPDEKGQCNVHPSDTRMDCTMCGVYK